MKKIMPLAVLALIAMSCQQPANKPQDAAAADSTATAAAAVQPKVDAYTSATNSGEKLTKKDMPKEEAVKFIEAYLKGCPNFLLATSDPVRPHLRPLASHFLVNNNLYLGIGDGKASCKELAANPNIEICAMNSKDHTWIRIIATAVIDTTSAVAKQVYGPTGSPKMGKTNLYCLSKVHAEISNAQQGFDVVEYQ